MAFPRSQRFIEKETCAPPPTAYHLPSVFDENNSGAWAKRCSFDHGCEQCFGDKKSNDHSVYVNKSNEETHRQSCIKQRSPAASCSHDNTEICYFQKKDTSNISRLKKNANLKLTEPKAPSFMTRPRHSIHNCFATNADEPETSFSMANFHRHSLKRKSTKPTKEKTEDSSTIFDNTLSPFKVLIEPSLQDSRKLNVSYVIREKISDKLKDNRGTCDSSTSPSDTEVISKNVSNITDDMKKSESFQNLDTGSTEDNTNDAKSQPDPNLEMSGSIEKEILEKDDSLHNEFLNNLNDSKLSNTDADNIKEYSSINDAVPSERLMEAATKTINIEVENAIKVQKDTERKRETLKSYNLSPDFEDHLVFLISEEFIDDEYDSYVNDVTLEKLHKMEDIGLFQICEALISTDMEKPAVRVPTRKRLAKLKKAGLRKMKRNSHSLNIKKLLKKKMNNSEDIWSEVEKIVRAAIIGLKGEFKNEIYRKTEEKIDTLMSKMARVLLKAEESIKSSCERTTVDLINKLEKIIN